MLVDGLRGAQPHGPGSLARTAAAALRGAAATVEALRRAGAADAEARALAERGAKLPPFAQRTAAQKLLGDVYDIETARQEARARLAVGPGPAAVGGEGGKRAKEEAAASARLELLEVKMTRIVAALERLGGRAGAGPGPAEPGGLGGDTAGRWRHTNPKVA